MGLRAFDDSVVTSDVQPQQQAPEVPKPMSETLSVSATRFWSAEAN